MNIGPMRHIGPMLQTERPLEGAAFGFMRQCRRSLGLMAVVTFLIGRFLVLQLLVTALAVLVKGQLKLVRISFFLFRTMAFAALLYRVAFLPHVLAILVHVVAVSAFDLVVRCMFLVGKLDRPFLVRLVPLVLDRDLIRGIRGSENSYR